MPGDSPERGVESRFLNGLYPDLSRSADVGKIALQAGIADTAPPVDKIGAYLEYLENIEGSDEQKKIVEEIIESSIREPVDPDPNETERRWTAHPGLAGIIEGFDYGGRLTPNKVAEVIRDRQRAGLRNWFDYLYGEEQEFPAWFRFYVATDLVRMSPFNQERNEFPRRSKNDNLMFPELDQEALAKTRETTMNIFASEDSDVPEKVANNPRFRNVYSYHYNNLRSISEDELQITDGEWVTFKRDSDPYVLAETLSGRGSGWCLAVYGDAARYLSKGDVLIYFSEDKKGQPVNPRIAITADAISSFVNASAIKPGFHNKQTISEIRGILDDQEMEPVMLDTIEEKLKELNQADEVLKADHYLERIPAARKMVKLKEKVDAGTELTDEELALIYGIPYMTEGFGARDNVIYELQSKRNADEDCERLFGCKSDEIAFFATEVEDIADDPYSDRDIKIFISHSDRSPILLPESLKVVVGDLQAAVLKHTNRLGNIEVVWGNVDLANAFDITSLGNLRMVSGNIITYNDEHMRMSRLNDIGSLEFIGGSVELMPSRIRDFKGLRFIGGNATFPKLPLEAFDGLEYIGGNATIIGIEEDEFRRSVRVDGDVTVIRPVEYEKSRSKLREFFAIFGDKF